MYNLTEQTKKFFKAIKKLVPAATQILNIGNYKVLAGLNNEFIGSPSFIIKKGLVKTFDSAFSKLCNNEKYEQKELKLNLSGTQYMNDFSPITNVEVKKTLTKLSYLDNEFTYIDTKYFLFINEKIEDVEIRITKKLSPMYIYSKGLFVGMVCPKRCIEGAFENDMTLEEYQSELNKKELNTNKNDEFLQTLANEYIEFHNKSLKEVPAHFKNIVSYELEKVNKSVYQVIGITKEGIRQYYFKLIMMDANVNLTEQKKIFSMIKDQLLNTTLELQNKKQESEVKINDLTVEIAEDTTEQDPQVENWNNKINNDKEVNKRLETLKTILNRRKKESPGLNLIPCNGYIISKILQSQGGNVQYSRPKYIKCYYAIKESTEQEIQIIFKDASGNQEYYTIYTNLKEEFY